MRSQRAPVATGILGAQASCLLCVALEEQARCLCSRNACALRKSLRRPRIWDRVSRVNLAVGVRNLEPSDFMPQEPDPEAQYPPPVYAWYVVGVLTFVYIFSFIDRQILTLLVRPIGATLE